MTDAGTSARLLRRRLSALDAGFLYIDTPQGPLNIGGISVFDGPLSLDVLVARLRERIIDIPRYRQLVVDAPLGLGHPFWEDDPHFDVARHVQEVHLPPPGDEATLKRAVAALHEGMLPRDRPLWQLYVVQGLERGRSALVSKIHHAMVDGVSGVELFEVLMDLTPDGHRIRGRRPPTTHPPSTSRQRLAEAVWDAAVDLAETGTRGVESLLSLAADPKAAVARLAQPLAVLANAGLQHVERLPFNRALTGGRRLSWLTLSLAELRAVRAVTGATLNDLVLSIVGDGVGAYLRHKEQPPKARSLRAMVPVDVRRDDEAGQLGNRVSIVPVEIPFDGAPLDRVATVAARTRQVKHSGVADLVDRVASAGGLAPAALYAAVLRLSSQPSVLNWSATMRDLSPLTANIVCTNVPGPQVPMYAQGRLLESHYPIVPLAYEFGLSFAIFSYNQRMFVGAIADAAAVDDLDALVSEIERAFVELRRAAGVVELAPVDVVRSESRHGAGAAAPNAGTQRPPDSIRRRSDPDGNAPPRPARKRKKPTPPAGPGSSSGDA